MTDLLVRGGSILDPHTPLAVADVRIRAGTIVEVAPSLRPDGEPEVDATGMLVMPGLVNAHTHSGQSLDIGIAPNLPLDLWMMWVVAGGIPLSADDIYVTAASGAVEMLRTGCTSVLDHAYVVPEEFAEQTDALMQAYADTGMRAAVAPMVQDRDFVESLPLGLLEREAPPDPLWPALDPDELIAHVRGFLERWSGRHPRLSPFIGPSAPQRCSDRFLEGMAQLAIEYDAGVHTHLLEAKTQVFATHERYGTSVVDVLERLGLVGPQASFAHCVWMNDREYATLAEAGATIVHNPLSNLRCGSGILPVKQLLELGGPVALGSDGAASNDNQNMFEVMKFATLLQTLNGDFRRWPTAEEIWRMGLAGGAAALREPIGAIRPGARGDLVLLDTERHAVERRTELVASLVLSEHGEAVDTVVVGGEVVMRERRCTRIDEVDLRRRADEVVQRMYRDFDRRRDVYASAEAAIGEMVDVAARSDVGFERLAGAGRPGEGRAALPLNVPSGSVQVVQRPDQ